VVKSKQLLFNVIVYRNVVTFSGQLTFVFVNVTSISPTDSTSSNMDKRTFLKTASLIGLSTAIAPTTILARKEGWEGAAETCTLIPSETAGPFPLDLTENTFYFRQDVREDRAGVPLRVRMKILGDANCEPMPNVRVNIWHCDKDGQYSGYDSSMNPGQAGKTYCRGYQIADANGEVEFTTIFPGWYPGRVCHIHFQVYVSSSYAAISQLTFPVEPKQALYAQHSDVYTKGTDPLAIGSDNVFADGYQYQLATLSTSDDGETYDSYLEVTVKGSGTTSMGHAERENAKHFSLGQNFPNPFTDHTTIPFTLKAPSIVTLRLFDLQGREVFELPAQTLEQGDHQIQLDLGSMGIGRRPLAYQLSVHNGSGSFVQSMMMTGAAAK